MAPLESAPSAPPSHGATIFGSFGASPPPPHLHHGAAAKKQHHPHVFAMTFFVGIVIIIVLALARWAMLIYRKHFRSVRVPRRREYSGVESVDPVSPVFVGGDLDDDDESPFTEADRELRTKVRKKLLAKLAAVERQKEVPVEEQTEEGARQLLANMMNECGLQTGSDVLVVKLQSAEHAKHNRTVGKVRHLEPSSGHLYVEMENGARLKVKAYNVLPNDLDVGLHSGTSALSRSGSRATLSRAGSSAGGGGSDVLSDISLSDVGEVSRVGAQDDLE